MLNKSEQDFQAWDVTCHERDANILPSHFPLIACIESLLKINELAIVIVPPATKSSWPRSSLSLALPSVPKVALRRTPCSLLPQSLLASPWDSSSHLPSVLNCAEIIVECCLANYWNKNIIWNQAPFQTVKKISDAMTLIESDTLVP